MNPQNEVFCRSGFEKQLATWTQRRWIGRRWRRLPEQWLGRRPGCSGRSQWHIRRQGRGESKQLQASFSAPVGGGGIRQKKKQHSFNLSVKLGVGAKAFQVSLIQKKSKKVYNSSKKNTFCNHFWHQKFLAPPTPLPGPLAQDLTCLPAPDILGTWGHGRCWDLLQQFHSKNK